MYKETYPTTERLEFDRILWSEWPSEQPVYRNRDWRRLYHSLGHAALEAADTGTNRGTSHRTYLRGNDHLSADDIRELESYLEFLRQHYGIPEGATVFPKRDVEPPPPAEPEDDDAA